MVTDWLEKLNDNTEKNYENDFSETKLKIIHHLQ